MKKLLNSKVRIILFPLVFFFFAMSPAQQNYRVQCLSIESGGAIKLKIWNTKAGKKYKSEQSMKDAVHAVLYAGITGGNSCASQPPLLNKSEEIQRFEGLEKDFFGKNGDWIKFTTSSSPELFIAETSELKDFKVYQVIVSKDNLKDYLEKKSIIKSLRSGF
jgi:hypothetical protein